MCWNFGLLTKTTWYKIYLCVSLLIQMAMELVEREREKKDEYICSVSSFRDVLYNITTFLELYLLQPRANFSATSRRTWGRGRVRCNQANIFFFLNQLAKIRVTVSTFLLFSLSWHDDAPSLWSLPREEKRHFLYFITQTLKLHILPPRLANNWTK